ncbi:MAG: glycosyltransferase [Candidatus Sedimenticola sp. (ex Thyasira tokunagai)]
MSLYKKYFAKIRQPISDQEIAQNQLSEDEQVARIEQHLAERRQRGEVGALPERPRVFAAVKNSNWEQAGLVDSWRGIADVVHYDWGEQFDQNATDWFSGGRDAFGEVLFRQVEEAHRRTPLDIFFSYLSGRWVSQQVIDRIGRLGIVTVNYDFDDSRKFWNSKKHGVYTGSAEIAPIFDLCVSAQSSSNVGKYVAIGANPLFLPSGGNATVFASLEPEIVRSVPVSFIGQKYGERGEWIASLEAAGVAVEKRGVNWPGGPLSLDEMLALYSRSLLTIGFGFIGNTQQVGMKGRDFEVPMTGCAYLTTYSDELAHYFVPGEEILFYRNKKELQEIAHYYVEHPGEAVAIGRAGRVKALSRHTWEQRWVCLLGVVRGDSPP